MHCRDLILDELKDFHHHFLGIFLNSLFPLNHKRHAKQYRPLKLCFHFNSLLIHCCTASSSTVSEQFNFLKYSMIFLYKVLITTFCKNFISFMRWNCAPEYLNNGTFHWFPPWTIIINCMQNGDFYRTCQSVTRIIRS